MDLGHRIRKGVKWLILGNLGQRALEFAFGVVLARLLVPADFGMVATVQAFTGFVGMVTTGGMGQALIRAKKVQEADFHTVFTLQMGIGLAVYLGFYLSAPWFAAFFDEPLYQSLLRISALTYFLRPFDYMYSSWLNREMEFRIRTLVNVATRFVTGATSILMALGGLGVWSLVLSGLVGGGFKNLFLSRVVPIRLRPRFDLAIMRRHGAYGSRVLLNDLLGHFTREGTNVMFSKVAGPAFLGLFNKADSLHRLPYWTLGQPLAQPLFRAMAKVQDDLDQTKYMYYRAVSLLMVYALPAFVVLGWLAQPFIDMVYGPKWTEAGLPLAIMTLAGPFYVVMRPCTAVIMAQNRLGRQAVLQALILITTLIACYTGLHWGLAGAAWGFVLTQILAAAGYYGLVYRILPTRLNDLWQAIWPGLMLNSGLVAALLLTDRFLDGLRSQAPALYMIAMGVLALAVYLPAFLFLPIPALSSEAARWKSLAAGLFRQIPGKRV